MRERPDTWKRAVPLLVSAAFVIGLLVLVSRVTSVESQFACVPAAPAHALESALAPTPVSVSPVVAEPVTAPPAAPERDAPVPHSGVRLGEAVLGVVVDAVGGEPVPEVDVELRCGGIVERLRVAHDGTFRTEGRFPVGRLNALVFDEDVEVGRAQLEVGEARSNWIVRVPIGPTFPFASIDGREPLPGDWQVRARETGLRPLAIGEAHVSESGGLAAHAPIGELPDRPWSTLKLRAGNPPFVRYRKVEFAPDSRYRVELALESRSLCRKGIAAARGTVGVQPDVIATTKALGRVSGTVEIPSSGAPVVRAMLIDDVDDAVTTFEAPPTWDEAAVQGGEYAFPFVTPGTKRLIVWAPGWHVEHALVVVAPGSNFAPTSRLVPASERASSARMDLPPESAWPAAKDAGHYLRLRLSKSGRFGPTWLANLGRNGELDTRDLPTGEYTVSDVALNTVAVLARDLEHETLPSERFGSPEFLVPEFGVHRFEFEGAVVRDANVPRAMVAFGPTGTMVSTNEGDAASILSASRLFLMPLGASFDWSAWSPGSAPRFGTEREFESRGEERVARVEFHRGWGAQLWMRAGDPAESPKERGRAKERRDVLQGSDARGIVAALAARPVPGIALVVDGVKRGTSGAEGLVFLSESRVPARIELKGEGWRLAGLERMPGPGTRYIAWLKPE